MTEDDAWTLTEWKPGIEVLPVDAHLDLECPYTSWWQSCRDPLPTLQQCRRRAGHDGDHAAGYGEQRRRWT